MALTKPHLRLVPRRGASGSLAGSTIFVIAATLGSAVLGFIREVVNARYYGTQWEMDTFLAAATIPTILFGIFQGALVSALVPTFSEYLTHGKEDEAWRLGNTVITALLVVLSVGSVLGYVFAPWYVPVIAHGFPPPQMGVAIHMTRWLMPSIVAVSLSGVFTALLNGYHRFRTASIVGIALNAVTIACVVGLQHRLGIFALVLGTALGLIAQMAVQLPALLRIGKLRLLLDLRHPGLRKIWVLLGPIIVGGAAGQVALFFDRYFASTLSPGYIAGMNYAQKLVNFPQQIFAAAIATVIFPLLASQFAAENRRGLRASLLTGLQLVNFITVPAMCVLLALARPIVEALFERGTFQSTATDLCVGLLPFAAVGLVATAANVVLTRSCFACKESAWPVAISVLAVLLNVLLSLLWLPTLGARGLLLANGISQSLQSILLLVLVWKLLHGFDLRALATSAGKVLIASVTMLGALHWISALNAHPDPSFAARGWYLFGQLSISALVFLAVARIVGVEELNFIWKLLVAKFERNLPAPSENRDAPIA